MSSPTVKPTDPARRIAVDGSNRHTPTTVQLAWLVALREIRAQLRSRALIISTLVFVVMIAAAIVLPGVFAGSGSDSDAGAPVDESQVTTIAVGPNVTGIENLQDPQRFKVVAAATNEAAVAQVESGEADAALIATAAAGPTYLPLTIVAESSAPDDVIGALTLSPNVSLLKPAPFGPIPTGYIASLVFGLLFLWVAIMFGQTIAQNTVIEKQTRIVEILLAAVPARALMAGKVVGNSLLALGETVILALTALIAVKATGTGDDILDLLTMPVAWYVVFFVIGFILLASLFAGVASLVSRLEDVSTAVTPLTFIIMIPYFLVLFFNSDAELMQIFSFIPILSTVAMPVRMVEGTAPWWEALISLGILIVTTMASILVGSRVYSYSLLQSGKKVKFLTALRAKD
jgi:ABC-2 type transport system permease protein